MAARVFSVALAEIDAGADLLYEVGLKGVRGLPATRLFPGSSGAPVQTKLKFSQIVDCRADICFKQLARPLSRRCR
jgi:hypothetical protein